MPHPETIPFYRDARNYDALNSVLTLADVPFYTEEAKRTGGPVLDLACGTGRLTIPIAQRGVEIVGLDQSASMLAHARAKAAEAGVHIDWVEADCRQFELGRKFALIFIGFNSMQHLHEHASLASLFARVRSHLAPGGRFIFDVFNPSIPILNRDYSERFVERHYPSPDGRGMITIEQIAVYDDAAQVNRITWYFSLPGDKDFRAAQLDLRLFFPQELDLLVTTNGFTIMEKSGNFERKPFAGGDLKQIVVCG